MRLLFAAAAAAALVVSQAHARSAPDTFAPLAERLSPSVVNIATTSIDPSKDSQNDIGAAPGSALDEILRKFRNGGAGESQRIQSLGSGFVIDASGIIVTNNHVISDALEISVALADGSRLTAEVIGRDPKTDIALLKVKPRKPLTAVAFGNSDDAKVGDWVLAIGNPFGLGGSVSAGIISARNRELAAEIYDDFIQTDAAINRGNSGGPLFNMDGEVVGVNAAIISPTGGSIGIGFAIPSKTVQKVVAQLRQYGQTRRGWIGVSVQGLPDELAANTRTAATRGALVQEVTPGGPGAVAGFKKGDIVVRFDGKDVADDRVMQRLVIETDIGRLVPVNIVRQGKPVLVNVRIDRREKHEAAPVVAQPQNPEPRIRAEPSSLGLSFSILTPAIRVKYRLPTSLEGLLVMAVNRDTPAFDNDIRPGDIIVEVGQEPVRSGQDLKSLVDRAAKSKAKVVLLTLSRSGALSFKALKLPVSRS